MSPARLIRVSTALGLSLLTATSATPALAADPPGKSITAVASARVEVEKDGVARNSKAIGEAVEAARAEALTAAIAAAREEGARVAGAGGLALGELWSVAEIGPTPFGPFGSYGSDGTFGPGKYCGTVRNPIFRRLPSGRRVLEGRGRPRFTCRFPADVTQTISVTFAATGTGAAASG
jgi:hypothetical protein